MARNGMSNLIQRVRLLASAGTADLTAGTVAYWTDNQIQDLLDQYRQDLNRIQLDYEGEYIGGGTIQYRDYYAPVGNLEEAESGTVYWRVEDVDGSAIGTASYSVDYIAGLIRFTADTGGTEYYLRARSYDLNRVAADIWRARAGSVSAFYSFQADNQEFKRSDWFRHCMDMALSFEMQGGVTQTGLFRNDLI